MAIDLFSLNYYQWCQILARNLEDICISDSMLYNIVIPVTVCYAERSHSKLIKADE